LIVVIADDHSGPPKPLFSLGSSGVRDVGVAGSNPVTPTTDFLTYFILDGGCFCHLVPGQKLFGPRFGPNFLMRGELRRLTPLGAPAGIGAGHTPNRYAASSDCK
jgi:hypothetical protein